MKLIALKCPSCNGDLSLDSDKEFGFCTYCGTKIFLDTVQHVQHSGSVAVDRNQEIQNLLARAAEYENRGMIADAERYYDRVLDIDNTDETARNGLDRTHGIVTDPNVTIERVPSSYDTRDRLAVKENGKSIARILQGEAVTIMLQVGEHELSFFIDGKLKKKLKVTIESPYERHSIACENKSLGRLDVRLNEPALPCGSTKTYRPKSPQSKAYRPKAAKAKKPLQNRWWVWVIIIAAFIVVFVPKGSGSDDSQAANASKPGAQVEPEATEAVNDPGISMEEFNAIEMGMSYEEITEIIGGEGELASETEIAGAEDYNTKTYTWEGESSFSNATIMIQGGKVAAKTQFGLE